MGSTQTHHSIAYSHTHTRTVIHVQRHNSRQRTHHAHTYPGVTWVSEPGPVDSAGNPPETPWRGQGTATTPPRCWRGAVPVGALGRSPVQGWWLRSHLQRTHAVQNTCTRFHNNMRLLYGAGSKPKPTWTHLHAVHFTKSPPAPSLTQRTSHTNGQSCNSSHTYT